MAKTVKVASPVTPAPTPSIKDKVKAKAKKEQAGPQQVEQRTVKAK